LLSANPGFAQNDPACRFLQGILKKPIARADLFAQLAELKTPQMVAVEPDPPECEPTEDPIAGNTSGGPNASETPQANSPVRRARIHISLPDADAPPAPDPKPKAMAAIGPVLEQTGPQSTLETEKPLVNGEPLRLMRILAAEDNKTNQLVFRKMVKDLPIDIRFANNGLEAVDAFGEFHPDMIFMDISMPKMDGKEATGEIRKKEAGTDNHIPIIALTAHAMDGDSEGILAAGLNHYMTKPLRKALIHEQIVRYCPQDAEPVAPLAKLPPG